MLKPILHGPSPADSRNGKSFKNKLWKKFGVFFSSPKKPTTQNTTDYHAFHHKLTTFFTHHKTLRQIAKPLQKTTLFPAQNIFLQKTRP